MVSNLVVSNFVASEHADARNDLQSAFSAFDVLIAWPSNFIRSDTLVSFVFIRQDRISFIFSFDQFASSSNLNSVILFLSD